jgi:MFS family permease
LTVDLTGPATRYSAAPAMQRVLRLSILEGVSHAIMVAVSESYLGALAVELGHGSTNLALLATVPVLAGAAAQLLSGGMVAWFGSRRRFVVWCAAAQAFTHLGFIVITLSGSRALWPLLGAKILFWMSGMALAPAWGAMMATATEGGAREHFFARRSAAVNGALLPAFLLAGMLLEAARPHALPAFALLQVLGLLARLGSAWLLARHDDPPMDPAGAVWTRIFRALREGHWRVANYHGALMLGVGFSVAFFTPYMLDHLGFSYVEYAGLTAISILFKIIAFSLYPRVAARIGLRRTLLCAGAGLSLSPTLWTLTDQVWILAFGQMFSGIAWAGVEFAVFQLLIQGAREEIRVEFLSLSASLVALAQVAGALLGSYGIRAFALTYPDLFVTSGVIRGLALVLLVGAMPQPVGAAFRLAMRIVSVSAVEGLIRRPVSQAWPKDPQDAP